MSSGKRTDLAHPRRREEWLARLMQDRLAPLLRTPEAQSSFLGVVQAALADRKVAACDPTSIALALVTCAELNLPPNGALDLAYLIPRGRTCTVQIGYKGLAQLAHRAHPGATLSAHVVYAEDAFSVELGTEEPCIKHTPNLQGDRSDESIVAAYACMRTREGGLLFEWLDRKEILQRRKAGGANSPAWRSHFSAMARKSAIRKLLLGGLVPLSPDLGRKVAEALRAEDTAPAYERSSDIVAEILEAAPAPADNPFTIDADGSGEESVEVDATDKVG